MTQDCYFIYVYTYHTNNLSLQMPLYTIASTAGFQVSVVEKLLGQENPDLEYDPPRGSFLK